MKRQLDLFCEDVSIPGFKLYTSVLSKDYIDQFCEQIKFEQNEVFVYGKFHKTPRLEAWFGPGEYTYSNNRLTPHPWFPEILEIKGICEKYSEITFNSCLANLYRDGNDYVSWHQDNEKELGIRPVIASLSLGEVRRFQIRKKEDHKVKHSFDLCHGDLIIMSEDFQQVWEHQLAKTKKSLGPRINLTFRTLKLF